MLGNFQLPNIACGPAGSANIMVDMRIGENGVLETIAVDQHSGVAQHIVHLARVSVLG